MKDVPITTPITVTLKAAEWYWLLGQACSGSSQDDIEVLDKIYAQIFAVTD